VRYNCQLPIFFLILLTVIFLSGCSLVFGTRTAQYIEYPVKSGDTFYAIGRRFSVSSDELMRINGIRDPRTLRAGQTIRIPYRGQSTGKTRADVQVARGARTAGSKASMGSDPLRTMQLGRAARHVGQLQWPVQGKGRISSRFGRRWLSFHEGIDIAASTGTPILAAHAGQVVYSGDGIRGYGNLVVLQGDDIVTVYGHNHRNRVRVGQRVRKGAHIADVGMTGKATGPHLHFETRIRDRSGKNAAIDPMIFYP